MDGGLAVGCRDIDGGISTSCLGSSAETGGPLILEGMNVYPG